MKSRSFIIYLIVSMTIIAFVFACSPIPVFTYESNGNLATLIKTSPPDYPETSFVVFSDAHLFPLSLGTEGKAFTDYITKDRKLIKESSEILESAVDSIKQIHAEFVLVPGDLSKDGERVSHELAANYLSQLKASGKAVYVIPGNHDIRNGLSVRYTGDSAERVPNISPDEFAQIYQEFGFKQAINRDTNSLSYVVEPKPGLWLLALDSNRYQENKENTKCITDGKFNPATLRWIEDRLAEAASNKKAVMVMMHHNSTEHYVDQNKDFGDYIVDDYQAISKLMAMYNARLVFTGHYHAQDIKMERLQETNKFVFDIETGSLVTAPCPYRTVTIDKTQNATIRSFHVQSTRNHPDNFEKYAYNYTFEGIKGIASHTIQGFMVDKSEADSLADQVAAAFLAHYAGDEKLAAGVEPLRTTGLSLPGWVVVNTRQNLVKSLWQDLEPADNNITIDLKTGQTR